MQESDEKGKNKVVFFGPKLISTGYTKTKEAMLNLNTTFHGLDHGQISLRSNKFVYEYDYACRVRYDLNAVGSIVRRMINDPVNVVDVDIRFYGPLLERVLDAEYIDADWIKTLPTEDQPYFNHFNKAVKELKSLITALLKIRADTNKTILLFPKS